MAVSNFGEYVPVVNDPYAGSSLSAAAAAASGEANLTGFAALYAQQMVSAGRSDAGTMAQAAAAWDSGERPGSVVLAAPVVLGVQQPAPGVGSGGTGGQNATGYVAPSVTVVQQPAGGSGVAPAPSPAAGGGAGSGQVLDVFGFLSGDGGAILAFGIVAVIGYNLLALLIGKG